MLDKQGKYQYSQIQKVVNRTYRKFDAELYFSQDKNELIFSYDDLQNQNFSIKIFDIRSILIFDEKITTIKGFNTKLYNLDWLKPGIYFANLENSTGQNSVIKFIKY
ncbi:MAG: T9SS type A sorting domain-containing protein [Saprospiraceae bacterium]|nr:T9SS type A sorting domain-containing protein [Saprospiraceae bacterium]